MLARISIGWRWLEKTLNDIIDAVNREKPLPSTSIAVEEHPSGSILKVTASGDQSGQGGGQQQPQQPQHVIWQGVSWKTVTVVDPNNNCAQSQISVLVQSAGGNVQIQ